MRVTRIPVIVLALAAVGLTAFTPPADAQRGGFPPLCKRPLNRAEPPGATTQPAARGSVVEGGSVWCQTGQARCPRFAIFDGRRLSVDRCRWRAVAVVKESPVAIFLVGSIGRYIAGSVRLPDLLYGGVCDSPLAGRGAPSPEACTATTGVVETPPGIADTAVCQATAGPWAGVVPPGATAEITVERCRLLITPYRCVTGPGAAGARAAAACRRARRRVVTRGRRVRVSSRPPKRVVDRRQGSGCARGGSSRPHIDLALEGLDHRTDDGRALGWGYGAVTATGGGVPEKTLGFGRTRIDRGQFGPYACGAVVTLTAKPAPGSAFDHWEGGDCAGSGPVCVAPVNGVRRERAIFRVAVRTVRVVNEQPQYGRVEGAGIICGSSGDRMFDTCTAVVRESESDSENDLFVLDARASNDRTGRYAVASLEGCHGGPRQLSEVHWRCYVKVAGADPVVTVTWKPR
jgi:hypothetical protein